MFRYAVLYRRRDELDREFRLTVTAKDADDARQKAALADPAYLVTIRSPRRGKAEGTTP